MANVIPHSFRGALFSGNHDFASGGNTFKLALYTSSPYNTSSTVYNATSEVGTSGTNYSTGGNTLTSQAVASSTAVASLDFGGSKTCTNGTFKITFPDPSTPSNAILSMA